MDAASIEAAAAEMIRLTDEARLAAPAGIRAPSPSVEDAYRIALAVLRLREQAGWRRLGRKIGFTNRTIYEQYGVYAPMFGYMYDRTVTTASDDEAVVSLAGLVQPLIEPEIVFRLRESPPRSEDPVELLGCVEWLAHGFEIVQCHYPDWKFTAAETIADGGLHGRYVVGRPVTIDADGIEALAESLSSFQITLLKDGAPAAEGGGDLVLGSPLNALQHLVGVLAALPDHPRLGAGELVTTGTLTAALPVSAGETWSTRIKGLDLPALRVRFGS